MDTVVSLLFVIFRLSCVCWAEWGIMGEPCGRFECFFVAVPRRIFGEYFLKGPDTLYSQRRMMASEKACQVQFMTSSYSPRNATLV